MSVLATRRDWAHLPATDAESASVRVESRNHGAPIGAQRLLTRLSYDRACGRPCACRCSVAVSQPALPVTRLRAVGRILVTEDTTMQTTALASVTRLPHSQRLTIETRLAECLDLADLLIAALDADEAPFEDIEDDDPSGDTLELRGEAPSDDGRDIYSTLPLYAVDQSEGLINDRVAFRAHMLAAIGRV